MPKKILFGLTDVLTLDAWLDHFEAKGFEVDGAMSGEDILGTARAFNPDVLVTEYSLKGELDGLGVYSELCALPGLHEVELVLVANFSEAEIKKLNKEFIQASGILGVVPIGKLDFESVEELL